MPTATLQEYLETIYKLSQDGVVRPTAIAEAIGVSGPTVTATIRRLEAHGLVSRAGTDVLLTDTGLARALEVVRRHRIAETFLVQTLGLPWNEVHEDACLLEHALSPRVLTALERFLDNPEVCPHGHPIPSSDGVVAAATGEPLCDVETGSTVRVVRVSEDDDDMLSYMGDLGLLPGTVVSVVERAPFDGPITLLVAGESAVIAPKIAALVTVEAV
ncbi:MAG: metal-dependent transcriptional regulator [Coriobacteriia bacterium]|nr:metal-dependent transcriptional regulator [Coriobacteriia bacterium]